MRTSLRAKVGLVVEAGDVVEQHHVAALVGYGAEAVHPWLALETVATLFTEVGHGRSDGDAERPGSAEAQSRYRTAIEKGLLKILAKTGISTLSSYCGAQVFEALGLGAEVIDRCFAGTSSPIGGIGFRELAEDVLARHRSAFGGESLVNTWLPDKGRVRFRKEGETHAWSPQSVLALQQAVGSARASRVTATGDEAWRSFVARSEATAPTTVRDLLAFRAATPLPIDEVESAEAIRARVSLAARCRWARSPRKRMKSLRLR